MQSMCTTCVYVLHVHIVHMFICTIGMQSMCITCIYVLLVLYRSYESVCVNARLYKVS